MALKLLGYQGATFLHIKSLAQPQVHFSTHFTNRVCNLSQKYLLSLDQKVCEQFLTCYFRFHIKQGPDNARNLWKVANEGQDSKLHF